MQKNTVQRLFEVNRSFYHDFGAAFSSTRRRIQPGVRRVLATLPREGRWLDVGCGNGALAAEWVKSGRRGRYLGLDFSEVLLEEARQMVSHPQVQFAHADLAAVDWAQGLPPGGFDGLWLFAVLHHLPSAELRLSVLKTAHSLVAAEGVLWLSVWQFQHSPRLMGRIQPWEKVGLSGSDVEAGDYLLDWRKEESGQQSAISDQQSGISYQRSAFSDQLSAGSGQNSAFSSQPSAGSGLRYVHLFSVDELHDLAEASGFTQAESFESDGAGGRLGLYQKWVISS